MSELADDDDEEGTKSVSRAWLTRQMMPLKSANKREKVVKVELLVLEMMKKKKKRVASSRPLSAFHLTLCAIVSLSILVSYLTAAAARLVSVPLLVLASYSKS